MIFYAPDCSSSNITYVLSETESKHCIKVLRKNTGDEIEIINGKGGQFNCQIINDHYKKCEVKILTKKQHSQNTHSIHIAMAIPKSSERLEWFAEKATEIGITRLTMLNCHHSERRSFNEKRLRKIMISALKQSKRFHLPAIDQVNDFNEFIKENPLGYLGHCNPGKKIMARDIDKPLPFLIGPEGDFSNEEIEKAIHSGYIPVQLSENRLRTETAALSAVFYMSDLLV